MRKFLIKTLVFLLLLPVVWIAGVCAYGSIAPALLQKNLKTTAMGGRYLHTRLQEADTVKNADLLILGSSHACRGFDPRVFSKYGIKIFNLGSDAQTPIQTDYLVGRYIDKIKVKAVIYEVYYEPFERDGLESALDVYRSVNKIDPELLEMAFIINKVKSYNTIIYSFFNLNVLGTKTPPDKKDPLNKYIPGGYIETLVPQDTAQINRVFASENAVFDNKQKMAFERTMKRLREKNIKVILVQTPIMKKVFASVANKDEIDKFFLSFGTKYYFNFNRSVTFDNNYYSDSHHLNQEGAERFDKMMIDTLNKYKVIM